MRCLPLSVFVLSAVSASVCVRRAKAWSLQKTEGGGGGDVESRRWFTSCPASQLHPNAEGTLSAPDIAGHQYNSGRTGFDAYRLAALSALFVSTMLAPVTVEYDPSTTTALHLPYYRRSEYAVVRVVPSAASALTEQQYLVDDVWKEVNRQFVDPTFNGLGEEKWRARRLDANKRVSNLGPDDKEQVYAVIRSMLEPLGDPYTRFLTPAQFESLTAYATGRSSGGVGVQLMGDPATGKIVVLNTIPDGPAARAGVMPGDIVEEIDGMSITGATAEVVAAKCRGDVGTMVNMAIRHGQDGRADSDIVQLSMIRSVIKVSPVEGRVVKTPTGISVGVIRIASFNQNTAEQVTMALTDIKRSCSAIVLDLRGNAGGYMPAGVDVAKLFLPPRARIISEVDKAGRATIYINDGVGSDTETPLFVLVDKRTASASEILTAALQDNRRAIVVGSTTFGKGRIQNVQPLGDGSGVAVTKAKYITPNGSDIQGVGIVPDKQPAMCGPKDSAASCLSEIL